MSTINVLTVVDAGTLMSLVYQGTLSPGTLENPTNLGSYAGSDQFIFMIADGEYVVNQQGQSELTIQAAVNDSIRWTITDPSADFVYNCMLYNFQSTAIGQAITEPVCNTLPLVWYCNSPSNPTVSLPSAYMSSYWSAQVISTSVPQVQYSWSFQVIASQSGNTVGYFMWDPFIQISS